MKTESAATFRKASLVMNNFNDEDPETWDPPGQSEPDGDWVLCKAN
jgi:hypothetical protein